MVVKNNKPEIRFKGFEGEWDKKDFNVFCWFQEGPGLRYWQFTSQGIKVINVTNLEDGFLNLNRTDRHISLNEFHKMYEHFEIQENDIVVASSGNSYGKVSVVRKCDLPLMMNTSVIRFKPLSGLDYDYLHTFLKSWYFKDQIDLLITGGAQPNFGPVHLNKIHFNLPPILTEQTKIGNYFQNLDSLIFLHQRKYDKLLTVKKAMLEKMFPKEGADVPEIRFNGFEGKWDRKKLGDLGFVAMNRRIFKDQTTENGEIPFYKIGTFGGKPDAFISRDLFNEYKNKYPYPKYGDILISASGSIGRTVEYLGVDEYFQDSNIVWLDHDQSITNTFLKYFYTVVKWEGLEGSTIKRLYNKNILQTKIVLPTVEEQTKIGTFFQNLDTLITQQQKELEKLKNLKRACLEKMFV